MKYTATEAVLRKLGLRALCQKNGHEPVRSDSWTMAGEKMYSCENCDAKFKIEYPLLDYTMSEE